MLQAKDIRRGQLDREITFVKPTISRGTANQDKITGWTAVNTYPTVFARVRELAGTELVVGGQIKFVQKTEFIVSYRTDLTTVNRLVFEDRVYEIVSVVTTAQRGMYTQVMGYLLDGESSPIGGGFVALAFTSGFRI